MPAGRSPVRPVLLAVMLAAFGAQLVLPAAEDAAAQAPGDEAALVTQGERLVQQNGCQLCHSTTGSRGAGPTWKDLAGSRVKLAGGQTVTADDAYLTRSILDPDAQIVDGFGRGVMAAQIPPGTLSRREAAAIVAYIKSLAGEGRKGDGEQAQPAPGATSPSGLPLASSRQPPRPAVYYLGWGLLALGVLLALAAVVGYLRFLPNWRRHR